MNGLDDFLKHSEIGDMTSGEIIKHFGVKGMRWGVRNDRVTLKDRVRSIQRERQWKRVLGEVDNLSDDQIRTVTSRIRMENELKSLVKSGGMTTKQDKIDYIHREKLSDDELSSKLNRIKVKNALSEQVNKATTEQKAMGQKIVNVGGTAALQYVTTGKLDGGKLFEVIKSDDKKNKQIYDSLKDQTYEELLRKVNEKTR